MSAAAVVTPKRPPAPRDQSVRGTYELFDRNQVREAFRKTDWRVIGCKLIPDLFRVCGSASKAAILATIALHTSGGVYGMNARGLQIRKKETRDRFSCNLTTSDIAKITGYSKRQVMKGISWAKEQGFLVTKGRTGSDAVRYELKTDAMAEAKNAADPEDIEAKFATRKGPNSAEDLHNSQASEDEEDTGNDEANERRMRCRTTVPHLGVLIVPGKGPQEVASFGTATGGTRRLKVESNVAAEVSTTIAPEGDIVLRISAKRAAEESPAPASTPENDSTAELTEGLAKRGLASPPELVHAIVQDLAAADAPAPPPVSYFLEELDRQIAHNQANRKPYKKSFLRTTARDVAGQWPAEFKVRHAKAPAASAAPPAESLPDGEVKAHLLNRAAAVEAVCPQVATELRSIAASGSHDLEAIERRLSTLDGDVLAAAQARLSKSQVEEIRAGIKGKVKAYSGKMTDAQIALLEQQYFERDVLEKAKLPRLSLFYMERG